MGQVVHLAVDGAELRKGKRPAGLAPHFDLTLECPAIHFRHETGERQDGTGLRHPLTGVDVKPKLQRFSGERLLCLGTVQQHPQDVGTQCERVTFSRWKSATIESAA